MYLFVTFIKEIDFEAGKILLYRKDKNKSFSVPLVLGICGALPPKQAEVKFTKVLLLCPDSKLENGIPIAFLPSYPANIDFTKTQIFLEKNHIEISDQDLKFKKIGDESYFLKAEFSDSEKTKFFINGDIEITGKLSVHENLEVQKDIASKTGDIKAGTISLKTHIHTANLTVSTSGSPSAQSGTAVGNTGAAQ